MSRRRAGEERDEDELVRGMAADDPRVVGEFLRRTHHPVYRMSGRLSADPDVRQDWTHEVLLGVLGDVRAGRFEYRGPGSFWGWFRKRAYYRLLDEYRRAKRVRERETPAGGPGELPGLADAASGLDPSEELERTEVRAALEECLARLRNADHRRALEALLFADLAYEAIAERLGAPLNTVRAWIRRGRLAVRRCVVARLGLELQPDPGSDPFSARGEADA